MNRVKESIRIKDFLTIKDAFFEVKAINILIGEQAQGKSIIAKLVYFFRSRIVNKFEHENIFIDFERFFPSYAWQKQDFSIVYTYDDCSFTLQKNAQKEGNNLTLIPNEAAEKMLDEHKKRWSSFLKFIRERIKEKIDESSLAFYRRIFRDKSEKDSIFIPAGRSFFVLLQEKIFNLLNEDIKIDPIISGFGKNYVVSKRFLTGKRIPFVDTLISKIIFGRYIYDNEQDWIDHKGRRTNLLDASSGQQEVLPMLLILRRFSMEKRVDFIIEEPEAHLYPSSQKKLISLFTYLLNTVKHSFFITTHSPYILTAINNLVIAKDAYQKAQNYPENLEKLKKFFKEDEVISLEDISAYTLKNGKLYSIIDEKNRLIGTNLLDAVSDEFQTEFDVAAEILYGDN